MNTHLIPRALETALSCVVLSQPVLLPQAPSPPARLVVMSNPTGARIAVNGRNMDQLTDTTFVVPPGTYRIAVTGGSGNLNCLDRELRVTSGQEERLYCTVNGWAQPPR
jgi:PEGA domain